MKIKLLWFKPGSYGIEEIGSNFAIVTNLPNYTGPRALRIGGNLYMGRDCCNHISTKPDGTPYPRVISSISRYNYYLL